MKDVRDPVCGMSAGGSGLTTTFEGKTFYFCSAKCKREFNEDPGTVLAMKEARDTSIERERSISLGKMIDAVAHEIRNPLTSIGGFARKIYKRLPQGDPNREYMKIIIDDAVRVENMIMQIIELKTMGVSRPEPLNINDIINEVLESYKKEMERISVEIELKLLDRPPSILLDSNGIKKVIDHLIRNALEAMEHEPRRLIISSCLIKEQMEIMVSDTGKGIPEDKIRYIFDPLFTSKIYGPGLGLTFARMIIQEHGGTISGESESDKGTVFTIRLPLKSY